ncbi:forkhead box protein R1 isoform X2 [Notamacropus eugenii]|uniref:forkhead box protein R1 isoform X2 n=1 Tax=Notamacropus eugenii TaxID=9315 RepID=UPI003B676F0D
MNPNLQNREFWESLHGKIPGLLDWKMNEELKLATTTDQLPRDTPLEPNLWMWVDLNIVCPPAGRQASKEPDLVHNPPSPKEEENTSFSEDSLKPQASTSQQPEAFTSQQPQASTSQQPEASTSQQPQAFTSQQPQAFTSQQPQAFTSQQPQAFTSQEAQAFTSQEAQDSTTEKEFTEEDKDEKTSMSLQSPQKLGSLRGCRRQVGTQTGPRWPRPPLNYCHLIALALKNSPSRGLNVQEIYNFTRQHFPFFQTAPEGWKNTVRHNLCFRGSFEKAPMSPEKGTGGSSRPRSYRWRLTKEGYRRFKEEVRALASARLHNIQKCMSQPEMMSTLFDL